MRRTFPIFVGLALLAVFFVAAAAQGDTTEPADPAEAAGIFSEVQAQRGRTAFLSSCAECHGIRLNGGMGPALAGDSFLAKWGARTVRELLDYTKANMPLGTPGTLPEQTYADIVAFILQGNGHVAGTAELTPDAASLAEVQVDPAN